MIFKPVFIKAMNEYAVVTGASQGIGKELAILLGQKGYKVILISRSEKELKRLSETIPASKYLAADLTEPGAAKQVADYCKDLPVSVLINNAGFGVWGDFETNDLLKQLNMLQLNISAVVELTYLLLPQLQKQSSYILNVASTAAYQAVPGLAVYAATKAFVLSFSRAIRMELKGKVSVSCLCPGLTDTGFARRAGMEASQILMSKFSSRPDGVARAGLKGMFANKAEIIPGLLNRLSVTGARLMNKTLVERVAASMFRK